MGEALFRVVKKFGQSQFKGRGSLCLRQKTLKKKENPITDVYKYSVLNKEPLTHQRSNLMLQTDQCH